MSKRLAILLFFALAGCAPTTATLIDDALESGDWQAVDARLEAEARRARENATACPVGSSAICISDFGDVDCRCVGSAAVRYELGAVIR